MLQLSDILDQIPEYLLPLIDNETNVLDLLNDSHHWLDLEQRLNHLSRKLCEDLPEFIYWFVEELQNGQHDPFPPVPLYEIVFRYNNREAFRYCPLRHLLVTHTETFTMCDEVEYMQLLDSIQFINRVAQID